MSSSRLRLIARLETGVCTLTGVLAVLTIFWQDWIEGLTDWDPDHHDGSFEALIILGFALASVVLGLLARRSWRQIRIRTAS